jgi:ATP-dependent DNA helicase PIF1
MLWNLPRCQKEDDYRHLLNAEQKDVLKYATCMPNPPSFFLSGRAGTGKSLLLREIIADLNRIYRKSRSSPLSVAVCAPSGIAAHNINGLTIHAWAGLDPSCLTVTQTPESIAQKVHDTFKLSNKEALRRWRNVKSLVIDECSMIHPKLLDVLDLLGRKVKKKKILPFGGIQVILCGDLFQLPPVPWKDYQDIPAKSAYASSTLPSLDLGNLPSVSSKKLVHNEFCFDARVWPCIAKNTFDLKTEVRQSEDSLLRDLLNYIRFFDPKNTNILFPAADATLRALSGSTKGLIQLSSKKSESLLSLLHHVLPTPPLNVPSFQEMLQGQYMIPELLLRQNTNRLHHETTHLCSSNSEVDRINQKQLDELDGLKVTYNSSDGIFVNGHFQDVAKIDDAFLAHPKHVSLAIGAKVLLTKNLSVRHGLVNGSMGRVVDFRKSQDESDMLIPVVQFGEQLVEIPPVADYDITPRQYAPGGICRTQIPLRLAYALSIHRSQGQTLNRISVGLRDIFEYGQLYVAMSRVKKLSDLTLVGYDDIFSGPKGTESVRSRLWKLMKHPRL